MKTILTLFITAALSLAQTITTINPGDQVAAGPSVLNTNFLNLNLGKMAFRAAYSGGTAYQVQDVVTSGGLTYVSLQSGNAGNTPASSPSWWSAIGGGGTGGGTWGTITGTLSSQTDLVAALAAKQATITTGTTGQYFRGDLSLATFPALVNTFNGRSGTVLPLTGDYTAAQVGLGNVLNVIQEVPLTFSGPLSRSVNAISLPPAASGVAGYLTAADWAAFTAKQNAITLGTTGQYLRGDLSLATFPTIPTLTGSLLLKGSSGNGVAAGFADIFALFTGCSGAMYPGFDGVCHAASGSGTVTSVTLAVPSWLTGGGTSTTAPSFTITPAPAQTSHQVIGTCGTATTFTPCPLVAGDIPTIPSTGVSGLPTFPAGTILGTTDTQTVTNKTIDGVSPATMAFVDATSSIQGQINSKQASLGFTPENAANKGAVSGYASLDGTTKVPVAQIPALPESQITNLVTDLAAKGTGNPGGYTTVTFSATPTFTAASNTASAFLITLTGNVTSSTLAGAATGQIITFKICQNSTGGFTFVFPTNVIGAGGVDGTASGCTNQSFVYDGTNAVPIAGAYVTGLTGGAATFPGATSGNTKLIPSAIASGVMTIPPGTDTLVGRNTTDTLANKTLTTPTIGDHTNAQHNHSNAAGGGQIAASTALSDYSALVRNNAVNTGTSAATFDLSPSAVANAFRVAVIAGAAATLNGSIAYDSTNNMLHAGQGAADAFIAQFTAVPANNDCVKWVVVGSQYKLGTQAAACGTASGGDTITSPGSTITVGGTPTNTTLDVATGGVGATQLAANAVTSAKEAVVNTRRTCTIDNDTQSATALIAAQFSGGCEVPYAATIVEVDVFGGTGVTGGTVTTTGTGSINLQKFTPNGGATTTLLSGALATATGYACALTSTSGTCINGTTSSGTITVSTTALSAGDWIRVSAATPDAAQTWYRIAIVYVVN